MTSGHHKHIFNDVTLALEALENLLWPNGIECTRCGDRTVQRQPGNTRYRCISCSRDFDYLTGTVLERLPISPPDLMYAAYVFSTSRYRASAITQLSRKIPAEVIEALWKSIQCRCGAYKGYKRIFGRLLHSEMPPTPLRVSGVRKKKLLAAGKHQSQFTIYPRHCLFAPKSVATRRELGRCECLLLLLLK
jgi:transposase-like protein